MALDITSGVTDAVGIILMVTGSGGRHLYGCSGTNVELGEVVLSSIVGRGVVTEGLEELEALEIACERSVRPYPSSTLVNEGVALVELPGPER